LAEDEVPETTVGGETRGESLLDLVSHDLINQQQAALGFLELLEGSEGLNKTERALLLRTVEALEHTARLLLQVRTALIQQETGAFSPVRVPLDKALDEACRTVKGIFAKGNLTVDIKGVVRSVEVEAEELLSDMLTQLFLLLGDSAPGERPCSLVVKVSAKGSSALLTIFSKGYALDPMVTDAITGERQSHGWTRNAASVTLVRHLLLQYGGTVQMESAPPGSVGAHMVIILPIGSVNDGIDNDR
jgi:signal transduction histidine kinase